MSQSFSLYTELTVRQNLDLHARLFHLPRRRGRAHVAAMVERFGLREFSPQRPESLPLGIRQRLQLAVAVIHGPEMLILDEPTSGVDPVARDGFWQLLVDLSRKDGVTVFISTHFMNEAERCDRISLMHAAEGARPGDPADLVRARGARTLEEAFIGHLEDARGGAQRGAPRRGRVAGAGPRVGSRRVRRLRLRFSPRASGVRACREAMEIRPRPGAAGVRPARTRPPDDRLRVRHHVRRGQAPVRRPRSRSLAREPRLRRAASPALATSTSARPSSIYDDLDRRLRSGELKVAIELPPSFGRDVERGRAPTIGVWLDGAMPSRAETSLGYVESVHQLYASGLAVGAGERRRRCRSLRAFATTRSFGACTRSCPAS